MEYVQFLVNPESKKLAVRKCEEDDKDSFLWCNTKRKPRHITCRIFFAMLANLMNWEKKRGDCAWRKKRRDNSKDCPQSPRILPTERPPCHHKTSESDIHVLAKTV